MDIKHRRLNSNKKLKIRESISLSNYTTWRVGGPAEWLAEPTSFEELKAILNLANQNSLKCQIIGAGSNLLISDKGVKGITLCMKKLLGSQLESSSGLIEAFSGEPIPTLCRRAAKAGLHGLEWAIGIPGTVGGAITMNAGAQGGCIAEWLESILVLDIKTNKQFKLEKKDLAFDYRQSRLQQESLLVISAKFRLSPGHNQENLIEQTNENLNHRITTQPYTQPSCGSVFRNPKPLKAGQLIEKLGLKGHQIGGAEISRLHANFIVNSGEAKSSDIDALICFIQKKILHAHGLLLHPEVKRVGFSESA